VPKKIGNEQRDDEPTQLLGDVPRQYWRLADQNSCDECSEYEVHAIASVSRPSTASLPGMMEITAISLTRLSFAQRMSWRRGAARRKADRQESGGAKTLLATA